MQQIECNAFGCDQFGDGVGVCGGGRGGGGGEREREREREAISVYVLLRTNTLNKTRLHCFFSGFVFYFIFCIFL